MKARSLASTCLTLLWAVPFAGCDDDDPAGPQTRFPYRSDETVIIGADDAEVKETPAGDACIELPSGDCIQPQEQCGEDTHADVLLDDEGNLIEIVCLPEENTTVIVDVEDGVATVPDNGAVVILEDDDFAGDVAVEGNNATIYGDGPAEAVIDGNLDLKGNESIVRGVTVTGDVTFDGNTAQLYYCVIQGDVILKGNTNFISNCTIFGSIRGSGNEDEVISNLVDGTIEIGGEPRECRDNRSFDDADEDLVVDEDELAASAPLDCE